MEQVSVDDITKKNSDLSHNHSLMTLILAWAGFAVMSSLYITIPLVSVFSNIFTASPTEAIWTTSVFSFCFAFACLFYGPLSDRFGRKKIMLYGISALAIVSIAIGFVNNLPELIILRGIQGAAAASFSPVALAYAGEMFPHEKRITAIGFITTGFLVAGIIGQVFSEFITWNYGWNMVFFLLGTLYLITALLIARYLPIEQISQRHSSIIVSLKQLGRVIKHKQLLLAYTVTLVLLLAFVGMYTILGDYLSSSKVGFGSQQVLQIRLIGVIGMLLSPFAGRLCAKFGLLNSLRGGLSLAIIGLALLMISTNPIILALISILFVAGIAIAAPCIIELVNQLGGEIRGSAVSMYTFVLFVGASIGPLLAMNVLLNTESYVLAFASLVICLIIGLTASMFVRLQYI